MSIAQYLPRVLGLFAAVACGEVSPVVPADSATSDGPCELDPAWREPAGGQPFAAVNSDATDWAGDLSDDGTMVVFTSDRSGAFRLWVARRASRAQVFPAATQLDGLTTDTAEDRDPSFNDHELYFVARRGTTSCLYVSRRVSAGFQPGRQLAICGGTGSFGAPYISRDEMRLYYELDGQLMMSTRSNAAQDFTPGAAVVGVPSDLHFCALSGDELTVYCERESGPQTAELWQASRASAAAPFRNPGPVSGLVEPRSASDPSLTADGRLLMYAAKAVMGTPELHLVERVCR